MHQLLLSCAPLPFALSFKAAAQLLTCSNPFFLFPFPNQKLVTCSLCWARGEREEFREMADGRRLLNIVLVAVAVYVMLPATAVSANKFTVGDGKGWNPNVNYTIWEQKHRPFYKGDWLVFLYQPGQADVVQVDEVGFNKCDASNPISNYSKGRSYAFELNETKTYYFICSYGYCYGGMKLAIKAEKLPPPSPPPSSDRSVAAFVGSHTGLVCAVVAAVALLLRMV